MVEAAILLAGGRSQRMGRDKSRLPFGDGPLASRVFEALSTVFPSVVVVTQQPDFPVAGARCVKDRHPGHGPLEGLASGLEALGSERALLAACDMPFLSTSLLRHLADQRDDADAIVPCSRRGPEPLLAVYSRRILPSLRTYLEEGNRSAMAFLEILHAREIPFDEVRRFDPEGRSFRNLNRPEDYAAALRELEAGYSQDRM
ncbi:Molybdenum cofactor guanylyltransferase [compost metagenome]